MLNELKMYVHRLLRTGYSTMYIYREDVPSLQIARSCGRIYNGGQWESMCGMEWTVEWL